VSEKWGIDGEGRHSEAQRRMLNAVCGDLANQIDWHGCKLDKDDWRHFLCGVATKARFIPGYNNGEGAPGFISLGKSSLKTTKSEMKDAITVGLNIGDAPSDQGLNCKPVRWCDAVLLGLGFNPNELRHHES
jgi:hypothetical protein